MKRLLFCAWNFCWILVPESGRLVPAKHPLTEKSEKVNVTPVAPARSAPPGQIHSGNQKNAAPLSGQMRIFVAMPGHGLRPVIGNAVRNRTLLEKCRLVRAKSSLSRHYNQASAETVIWSRPNTFFRCLKLGLPSVAESVFFRFVLKT